MVQIWVKGSLILNGTFSVQVISVMSMWTRLQPAYSANMWNEALNKRLGTEVSLGSKLFCVDEECEFALSICSLCFYFSHLNKSWEGQVILQENRSVLNNLTVICQSNGPNCSLSLISFTLWDYQNLTFSLDLGLPMTSISKVFSVAIL